MNLWLDKRLVCIYCHNIITLGNSIMDQQQHIQASIVKHLAEITLLQQQIAEEEEKLLFCLKQERQLLKIIHNDQLEKRESLDRD